MPQLWMATKSNLKMCLLFGSLLAVIKCIYLSPTYLHFIQDIEDMCLLLMSSTSFVDLPFQERRMTEKHIWTKIHAYLHYVQNKA
jgi:hypothetical protein